MTFERYLQKLGLGPRTVALYARVARMWADDPRGE